jgi:hypothetical protein
MFIIQIYLDYHKWNNESKFWLSDALSILEDFKLYDSVIKGLIVYCNCEQLLPMKITASNLWINID